MYSYSKEARDIFFSDGHRCKIFQYYMNSSSSVCHMNENNKVCHTVHNTNSTNPTHAKKKVSEVVQSEQEAEFRDIEALIKSNL